MGGGWGLGDRIEPMARFITSWVLSGVALAIAALLLGDHMNIGDPDDPTSERILALVIIALVFTLINMFIAPIVKTLSIPFIVVTLGLFLLVINAILLLLTKWITDVIDLVVFHIDGFWWALLGGLIVSIVNAFLGGAVKRNA